MCYTFKPVENLFTDHTLKREYYRLGPVSRRNRGLILGKRTVPGLTLYIYYTPVFRKITKGRLFLFFIVMENEAEQSVTIDSSASSKDEISPLNPSLDNAIPDSRDSGLKALCLAIDISSNSNDHMKRPLYVSPLHVFPGGDPATWQVAKTMDFPASEASFSFSKGFEFDELVIPSPKPVDEYSLSSLSPCSDDESDECFQHSYSHEQSSPVSEPGDEAEAVYDFAASVDEKPIRLKTFSQIIETVAKKTSTPAIDEKRAIEIDRDQVVTPQERSRDESSSGYTATSRKPARKSTTKKKTTSTAKRRQQRKERHPTKYTRHATLPRSKNGCWTCRCRRKKCDEAKPSCRTCINLGVPCAGYSSERPDFMVDPKASVDYRKEVSRIIREQKTKPNEKRINSQI